MDVTLLSRLQFATTTIYHFFFVPLTLGLAWLVVILETLYVRTGKETYKRLAKFWGGLLLVNFAMGVVTGIVLEFQFGMNWSAYARYVGDIFGAPLAIEALLTFFLESTFLGVWIFGWERLSKRVHAAAIWLVAIGSTLSALWILIANGFMQHPVGYTVSNGRAQMTDFMAVALNPRAWFFFWHTLSAGLATAAFFVLGISAYHLAQKQHVEDFQVSFRMAAVVGLVASLAVVVAGDAQSRYVREVQPMTAAASEGLLESDDPAPFSVATLFDSSGRQEIWSLRIPAGLSLLYFLKPEGEVQGIHELQEEYAARYGPGDYIPPVALDFWTFRIMVGVGFLMIAITAFALYLALRRFPENLRWPRWTVWVVLLPYVANTTGWILTETGRQPWIVYGLLKTEAAASPNLSPGLVLGSLIGFALVYAGLLVADVYLLTRLAKAGPSAEDVRPVSRP